MKLPRRQFLHLAAGAAALPACFACRAGASLSVAASAHGSWQFRRRRNRHHRAPDGQRLSERLGQPFVIENRPGAGTNIATEAVVRAPPDGYTLLLVDAANAINATLYENSVSISSATSRRLPACRGPLSWSCNPSFPVKTVHEFIAYAKANPGKINMASAGKGASHIWPASCSRSWPVSTCPRAVSRCGSRTHRSDRWAGPGTSFATTRHRVHQGR